MLKWIREEMGVNGGCPRLRLRLPMGNVMVEHHTPGCIETTEGPRGWVLRCDGLGLGDRVLMALTEDEARAEVTEILASTLTDLICEIRELGAP